MADDVRVPEGDILDPAHDPNAAEKVTPPDDKAYQVSDDGNIVTVNGKKYITDAALHGEREKNKQLQGVVDQVLPVLPEFQTFLQERESRQKAAAARAGGVEGEFSDDDLEAVATVEGYYKEDGTVDKGRAKQKLVVMQRVADRASQKHAKPLNDAVNRILAETNQDKALSATYVDGEPVASPVFMKRAFEALKVNPELLANQEVSQLVQIIAAGMERLDERAKGKGKRREPLFTEGGDARVNDDGTVTSKFDDAARRARGKTQAEWKAMQKRVAGDVRRDSTMEDF